MALAWNRPELATEARGEAPSFETVALPRVATDRPWILFVGADVEVLEAAAGAMAAEADEAGVPVLELPKSTPLPVAIHRLSPPELEGERLLLVRRIDLELFSGSFSVGSALYVLPTLVRSAGSPLAIVATALEGSVEEAFAQRGLWSRFEVRRMAGDRSARTATGADAWDRCEAVLANEPESGLVRLFQASKLPPAGRVPLLKEAAAIEPDVPAAHYELGKALIQTDDIEGAVAAFRRTTALLPDFASAWGNLGAALGEAQKLDESVEALTQAVALDPLSHALHSNLGVALRDQGRLEQAEARLRAAIELAPDFVFGHYNLGSVLFLAGRYEEAIAAFERGRERDWSRSPRQSLLLAVTRLAAGDVSGAHDEYRRTFERAADEQTKDDLRRVAEWDLKELAARLGVSEPLRQAARLVKSLA